MIVFDLRCGAGHVFEAWLASSEAYETQRASGMLGCPVCGNDDVSKAVMAPAIAAKGNQTRRLHEGDPAQSAPPPSTPGPMQVPAAPMGANLSPQAKAEMERVIARLAEVQTKALEGSQWVGEQFVDQARAMHYGDRDHAPIHGIASAQDAREMMEEGMAVAPLPLPVIPPDKCN